MFDHLGLPHRNYTNVSTQMFDPIISENNIIFPCPDKISRNIQILSVYKDPVSLNKCFRHCLLPSTFDPLCQCRLSFPDNDNSLHNEQLIQYKHAHDQYDLCDMLPNPHKASTVQLPYQHVTYPSAEKITPRLTPFASLFKAKWNSPKDIELSSSIPMTTLTSKAKISTEVKESLLSISYISFPLFLITFGLIFQEFISTTTPRSMLSHNIFFAFVSAVINFIVQYFFLSSKIFVTSMSSISVLIFSYNKIENDEKQTFLANILLMILYISFYYFNYAVIIFLVLILSVFIFLVSFWSFNKTRHPVPSFRLTSIGIHSIFMFYHSIIYGISVFLFEFPSLRYFFTATTAIKFYVSTIASNNFLYASVYNASIRIVIHLNDAYAISPDTCDILLNFFSLFFFSILSTFILTMLTRNLNIYTDEYSNSPYFYKKFTLICHVNNAIKYSFVNFFSQILHYPLSSICSVSAIFLSFFLAFDLMVFYVTVSTIHWFFPLTSFTLQDFSYVQNTISQSYVNFFSSAKTLFQNISPIPYRIAPLTAQIYSDIVKSTVSISVPNGSKISQGNAYQYNEYLATVDHIGTPAKSELISVNGSPVRITNKTHKVPFIPSDNSRYQPDSLIELNCNGLPSKKSASIPDLNSEQSIPDDPLAIGYSSYNENMLVATKIEFDDENPSLFKFNSHTKPGDSGTPLFLTEPFSFIGIHSQADPNRKGWSYGILNPTLAASRVQRFTKRQTMTTNKPRANFRLPISKCHSNCPHRNDGPEPAKHIHISDNRLQFNDTSLYPSSDNNQDNPPCDQLSSFLTKLHSSDLSLISVQEYRNLAPQISKTYDFLPLALQYELYSLGYNDLKPASTVPIIKYDSPTTQGSFKTIAKILIENPSPEYPFPFNEFCNKYFTHRDYKKIDFATALKNALEKHSFFPAPYP